LIEFYQVEWPKDAIIGIVIHEEKTIISRGDTRIMPGDKVVVASMFQVMDKVKNIFKQW
jgi:Trk K+ transport system NAD-binding subunit